jgi:hypothetical protein
MQRSGGEHDSRTSCTGSRHASSRGRVCLRGSGDGRAEVVRCLVLRSTEHLVSDMGHLHESLLRKRRLLSYAAIFWG